MVAQCLDCCTPRGTMEEIPGCWFQLRSSLALVAIWALNQQMAELSLSAILHLLICLLSHFNNC